MSAAFQSSAFQQNAFQSSVNVSFVVTGVSATGSVGTVSISASGVFPVTTVDAVGYVGTVSVFGTAIVAPTGPPATGELDSVVVTGTAVVPVTGISATGEIDSVTVTGTSTVPVTGVFATGELGSVAVTGTAVVDLTGVEATAELGNEAVITAGNVSFLVDGVHAHGQLDSVTVTGTAVVDLTGVEATGELGSVTVSLPTTVLVTGVTASGELDSVTVTGTAVVSLTGVEATGEVGNIEFPVDVVLTGVFATGELNSVTVSGTAVVDLTGVEATGELGSVTISLPITVPVTGVSALGELGELAFIGDTVISVTGVLATSELDSVVVSVAVDVSVTGLSATGELDSVVVYLPIVVYVTGVFASGELGSVTLTTTAVIELTGVEATGELGNEAVVAAGNISFLVDGVHAHAQLGDVSAVVNITVEVTGFSADTALGSVAITGVAVVDLIGVEATGELNSVDAIVNAIVSVTGVGSTSALASVTVYLFNGAEVTGVFATGLLGPLTTWITIDDRQTCSWVQVPITAGGGWITIDPCNFRVDIVVTPSQFIATGEVGDVASGSFTFVPLSNTDLLTTGQIGSVSVESEGNITVEPAGVQASGVIGPVTVDVVSAELVSLLRAWNVYDGAYHGFPNYQAAVTFEGSQAPLVSPLNVWAKYFGVNYSDTQTKNTEYSLLYYFDGYEDYGGQTVYEYPYNPQSEIVYFNPITVDYTQELWVYIDGPSPAPEGFQYDMIAGNGDGSNYPLVSGYKLLINDAYELTFSIWIDAADYNSPTYTISGGTVPLNEWVHLAVSRSSNIIRVFINGVSIGTITYSGPISDTPSSLSVSDFVTQIESVGASIYTDSFRWINGLALYTSNFTPPAYFSPYFSDVVGLYMVASLGTVLVYVPTLVSLVTPWSGGLGSTSSYPNFTVANATNTGSNVNTASDVFDAAQAPMVNPDWLWYGDYTSTMSYYDSTITKNYNYSVKFPGLYGGSISTNAPPRISSEEPTVSGFISGFTQKLTCEAWVYVSYATPPTVEIDFIVLNELSGIYNVTLRSTSDRKLQLRIFEGDPVYDYVVDVSGGTIPYNSWTHLALSVNGSSIKIFINGTEVASASYDWYVPNTTYQISLLQSIGYSSPATYVYLDSFRLIGASNLYTSNFTPPAYFSPYFSDVVGLYMVTSVGTVTVPEP